MVDHDITLRDDLDASLHGRGFVDRSDLRKVRISGDGAVGWLHDLLTADIAGLEPGAARRSLILTPTGHVRADVHVVRRADDVVLLQTPDQPDAAAQILAPYVLSSDVALEDVSDAFALFAIPDADAGAAPDGLAVTEPSTVGPGIDVLTPRSSAAEVRRALRASGLRETGPVTLDAWRIVRGIAKMGPDFDARSIPAEAGLDDLIDTTKGCFLGQESVARVRNLGHPPRVLRHMRGDGPLSVGDAVRDDAGDIVGAVTSTTPTDDRWIALVRVSWSASNARLTDTHGRPLRDADRVG